MQRTTETAKIVKWLNARGIPAESIAKGEQDELLVRYPGAIGGKTGYTNAARKTFVGAAERDGRRLVIAMMYGLVHEGGPTYWDQAAALLNWGFAQSPAASIATL